MHNFGEELTYWYLRLNGFFLIHDYLMHGVINPAGHESVKDSQLESADADLLGVRPLLVQETIRSGKILSNVAWDLRNPLLQIATENGSFSKNLAVIEIGRAHV